MPRRSLASAFVFLLAALAPGLVAGPARADDPPPSAPPAKKEKEKKRYFYFGRDYGSEALFNPVSLFLNRGFDALQLRRGLRNPLKQPYEIDAANVINNLASPIRTVDGWGWKRFLTEEVFPINFTAEGSRWLPNYGLHLLGGGVDFVALREWYEDQGVPAPAIFGALSLYAAAFMNETIENYGITGPNTDALADLYIFDLAGILLFSIDDVAEFFHTEVILSDWSLQPMYTLPRGNIHNQGNYFSAKWPLPFEDRLRLFVYGGYSSLAGVSWRFPSGHSLSAAGGVKVAEVVAREVNVVDNVITFEPSGAVFFDHDESLLASLQVANVEDYFIHFNVYPNAFFRTKPGLGFFGVIGKDGKWMTGISVTGGLYGLGAGTL